MLTGQNLAHRKTHVKIIIYVGWMLTMVEGNLHTFSILIISKQRNVEWQSVCPDNRDMLLSNASPYFHFFLKFTDVPLMWSGYFCELLENFTHTLMVPMNTKYLFQRAVANKQYF